MACLTIVPAVALHKRVGRGGGKDVEKLLCADMQKELGTLVIILGCSWYTLIELMLRNCCVQICIKNYAH